MKKISQNYLILIGLIFSSIITVIGLTFLLIHVSMPDNSAKWQSFALMKSILGIVTISNSSAIPYFINKYADTRSKEEKDKAKLKLLQEKNRHKEEMKKIKYSSQK